MKKRTLAVKLLALASAGFSFFWLRKLLQTAENRKSKKVVYDLSMGTPSEKEKILLETPSSISSIDKDSKLQIKDDLTQIVGIGPKYQSILNNAGINTYHNLAGFALDELETILRNANVRIIHCENWIEQAKNMK